MLIAVWRCTEGAPLPTGPFSAAVPLQGGRGGGRPGTISQGIISPGENFATLEIPKGPSKHVSRKMSLNFRHNFSYSRLLDEFLYRLYGMYLAVLAARMAAGRGDQAGHGTLCSRTSRDHGPATPSPRTTSSAPSRGMRFVTTGVGPRYLSGTWFGGHGRWPGCRGQRKCPGLSWP